MEGLCYTIEHVFMPPKLPQAADFQKELANDYALAKYVARFANEYHNLVMGDAYDEWVPLVAMLKSMKSLHGEVPYTGEQLKRRFSQMVVSGGTCPTKKRCSMGLTRQTDVTALLVRKQNAGLIFRRGDDAVIVEAFEVSAPSTFVVQTEGKLQWSFPGSSVAIPINEFSKPVFQEQLASFITEMNQDDLEPSAVFGGHQSRERAVDPKYITDLLMTILAAVGGEQNAIKTPAKRITKRIGDDALSDKAPAPWRRSALWLVIRVALQTTLNNANEYKSFMIYFMASILKKSIHSAGKLESATLDHMRRKIARRAAKLKDTIQEHSQDEAIIACEAAQAEIESRWQKIQDAESEPPTNWDPLSLDVDADTRLKLTHSSPYINNVIYNQSAYIMTSSYTPTHGDRLRDVLGGFNSMLTKQLDTFKEGKDASLVLADFEAAVSDDLTDWVAMSLDDDAAPGLLVSKLKEYSKLASVQYANNAENLSLMTLIQMELWVAIDKFAVDDDPTFNSYPPEMPLEVLEPLLFRTAREIERVRDVALYLRRRISDATQANRPSVFKPLSPWSYSVQYFGTCATMRDLKASLERQANQKKQAKITELGQKNVAYRQWVADVNATAHSDETCNLMRKRKRKRTYCPRCLLDSTLR